MKNLIVLFLVAYLNSLAAQATPVRDTLVVGLTEAAPFILDDKDNLHGISVWLWENISEKLDVHYEYKRDEFANLLSSLQNGEIDMIINPLTLTPDRYSKFLFTVPFYASNSALVVQESNTFDGLLRIFSFIFSFDFLEVIIGILLVILCFGFLLWIFERKMNPLQFRKGIMGIFDGMWWSAVTMTTVGYGDKVPKSTGGKVLGLTWMFIAIILLSSLTATIATSLTLYQMHSARGNIEAFKNTKVGTISNSGTYTYLKNSFFNNVKVVSNLKEGLQKVKTKELDAFAYDEPILAYRLKNDPGYANLKIMPYQFHSQLFGWGLHNQHQDLADRISQEILEITCQQVWTQILHEYNLK